MCVSCFPCGVFNILIIYRLLRQFTPAAVASMCQTSMAGEIKNNIFFLSVGLDVIICQTFVCMYVCVCVCARNRVPLHVAAQSQPDEVLSRILKVPGIEVNRFLLVFSRDFF